MERWAKLEEQKQRFQQADSAHSERFWLEYKKSRAAYTFQFDQTQRRLRLKYRITR